MPMMVLSRIPSFAALAVALATAFTAASANEAHRRCSLVFTPRLRESNETALLVTPTSDTMVAGAGLQPLTGYPGHSGPGSPGVVSGQLVNVERFGGSGTGRLAAAFRATGRRQILIVPWDYDSGCLPTRWTARATWLETGILTAMSLRVRPESLWVNGIPVFDAFDAEARPYVDRQPSAEMRMRVNGDTAAFLTAAERYEMLMSFPPRDGWQADPVRFWRKVLAWQRENATLALRYPAKQNATDLADEIVRFKEAQALKRASAGVRGTYRLRLQLDSLPPKALYFRTFSDIHEEWLPMGVAGRIRTPFDDRDPPTDLVLYVTVGLDAAALPTNCNVDGRMHDKGYFYERPEARASAKGAKRLQLDVALISRLFPKDSALKQFTAQASREWGVRIENMEVEAPGRVWHDGKTQRVDYRLRLLDGRMLTFQGSRVDTKVIDCA